MTERQATCKICGTQWTYYASRGPTATTCQNCKKERNKRNIQRFLEKKRLQRMQHEDVATVQ